MAEIDFEATTLLAGSGFGSSTIALVLTGGDGFDDVLYINDPIMSPQELLEAVTNLLINPGYVRLAALPRDVEKGTSPRVNVFSHAIDAVRSLTVDEVGS